MDRVASISQAVRRYDPKLYCARDKEGKPCIYRKSTRWETYWLDEENALTVARPTPHFIFALTDNWKSNGKIVDWGLLPIIARLKAIDLWNRDLASLAIDSAEKASERAARETSNTVESFLYDFHSQFKKTFKDVRTSNMSKTDSRKKEDLKHGNR